MIFMQLLYLDSFVLSKLFLDTICKNSIYVPAGMYERASSIVNDLPEDGSISAAIIIIFFKRLQIYRVIAHVTKLCIIFCFDWASFLPLQFLVSDHHIAFRRRKFFTFIVPCCFR